MNIKIILSIILTFISFINSGHADMPKVNVIDEVKMNSIIVTATVYHAISNQTDDTPLITASNKTIDIKKLNKGHIKWIAVSPDLMRKYKFSFGDEIIIESSTNKKLNGIYFIEDVSNVCIKNTIDILVPIKFGAKFKDYKCVIKFYDK